MSKNRKFTKCGACQGKGECRACQGLGAKTVNYTHKDGLGQIVKETIKEDCSICAGTGTCQTCEGFGGWLS